MPEVVAMTPKKSDAELADQYRKEFREASKLLCEVLDRAKVDGLVINFSIGPDQIGRSSVKELMINKPL